MSTNYWIQHLSLQDIHILHRGGAQIPTGLVMNNLLLDEANFYWTLRHV